MEYKLFRIKYMSGTGNSYRAATWMKEAACGKGIGSELGLAFPTHGFTAPWMVIRHALQMPWDKGQDVFAVSTKGALMIDSVPIRGFEGSAAYLISLILLLRGYRIRGVMGLDMPANMISVHSGLTVEASRMIIGQARKKQMTLSTAY